jgi:hypothetical protein
MDKKTVILVGVVSIVSYGLGNMVAEAKAMKALALAIIDKTNNEASTCPTNKE